MLSMLLTLLPVPAAAKDVPEVSPFEDVSAADWYYEATCYVKEHGLMYGTDAVHFSPNIELTRGMIVTILHRMDEGTPASAPSFPDVSPHTYCAAAVGWAAEKHIVSGYPDGRFGPDDPITRQQLATILYRYVVYRSLSCPLDGNLTVFDDANQISEYARSALSWAVGTGLICGTSKTTLSPSGNATRAQAAVILMRLAQLIEAAGTPAQKPTGGSHGGSGGSSKPPTPIEPETPEDDYAITALEVTGDQAAVVTVSTQNACQVTVSILDAGTKQPLYSTSVSADAQSETQQLTIPLEYSLPEYFIVKATLTDRAGTLLCNPFISMHHTKAYEQFEDLTVDSFPGDVVINFDNDPNQNFGVLAEGSVKLDSQATVDEKGIVTVTNASEDICSTLEVGDVLYLPTVETEDSLIKIAELQVEGDTIKIVPEENVFLSDFYQVLKVDMSFGQAELQEELEKIETAALPHSAVPSHTDGPTVFSAVETYAASTPDNTDTEYKFKFDSDDFWESDAKSLAHVVIEGALMTSVKIEYDVELFGEDYIYQEIAVETAATGSIALSQRVSSNDPAFQNLTKFYPMEGNIPINIPGAALYIKAGGSFDFECEAGGSAIGEFHFKTGFIHDGDGNVQTINEKSSSFVPTLKGKVEFSFGPSAELGLRFCKDTLQVGITAGFAISAQAENDPTASWSPPGAKDIHSCMFCVKGRVGPKLSLSLNGKYELSPKLHGTFLTLESAALIGDGDFFYSGGCQDTNSIYGGFPHFGMGTCRNHKYMVDFTVRDPDGAPLSGIPVTVSTNPTPVTVTAPGSEYFYNGTYLAEANINEKTTQETFTVADGPQSVTLTAKNPSISGTVTERIDSNEQPLSGVSVVFRKDDADGEILRTLTTGSNGSYQALNLRQGMYHITFSKDGYETKALQVDLKNDQQVNIVLAKVSSGLVNGTITDEVSHAPIPSVSVTASQDSKIIASVQSDQNGCYTMTLPVGSYQILFSKAGYNEKTDSLTIVPGQPAQLNPVLTPIAGSLSVTVTDGANKDAPIAGALVEVKKDGTVLSSGTTDEAGIVTFTALPTGNYELQVSKEGYASHSVQNVTILENPPAEQSVRLHPGGNCGPTLYWELENGTLTIFGQGEMYNSPSFSQFASEIQRIIVKPGATNIGSYAFYNFQNLASVTLPDSVTKIGAGAFAFTALTSVEIPNSVTLIEEEAFSGCKKLSQISLGQKVETIKFQAFSDCSSLTAIELPASVRTIGNLAFDGCSSLADVKLNDGLLSLGDGVFNDCSALTTIHIPNSVTTMGSNVFYKCTNLREVTLPQVTAITSHMFDGCAALTTITIPESVTDIHAYAFSDSGITEIVIPDSVKKIWDEAFIDADALKSVTFSDSSGLLEIGRKAFYSCSELSGTITLPSQLTTIGANAFKDTQISVVEMKGPVRSIGWCAFGNADIPSPILRQITYPGTSDEFHKALASGDVTGFRELKDVTVICTDGIFTVKQAEGLVPKS